VLATGYRVSLSSLLVDLRHPLHRHDITSRTTNPPIAGEAAVGKSSLVSRFVQNDFNENTSPTIGAAFLTQSALRRPARSSAARRLLAQFMTSTCAERSSECRLENRIVKFEIW
jgi:hypothetical protein